jgi:CO/xanthine dehydrogenase Mo-binding subunit
MSFAVLGRAVPRAEGADKVAGRTLYAADVSLPGMLWGKILRSPHPHARIVRIDAERARRAPGVRAVLTGAEIPRRYVGKAIRDMPVLCWDVVRFVGDRVAAVAADSPEQAEDALALIEVEYDELPAVFDPIEAMRPDAPLLHADVAAYDGAPKNRLALDVHNGLTRLAWKKGDIERGFGEADLIFEHTFRVPARHQGYLEPHASVVAIESGGKVTAWTSAKNPFGVRAQTAKAVGVAENDIAIQPINVGGEFGGKGDACDLPVAYFLAQKSGRPVKIVMSYAEELAAGNPAHPAVVTVKSGVKRDGRILARKFQCIFAGGAYGANKANAALATWHYAGVPYRIDNAEIEYLHVYTNTVPGGYYRSPGSIATVFALESHTDLIARELGMDAAEFRMKNLLRDGDIDATGEKIAVVRFPAVLREALDAIGWKKRKAANRGRGIALFGRHISGGDTGITLTAESDGSLTLLSPTVDQGAGTHTILRQLAAEAMEIPVEQVRVVLGDTDTAPRDSGARASRMTYVAGQAVVHACRELKEMLLAEAAQILESRPDEIEYRGGRFYLREDPSQQITLRRVAARAPLSVTAREDFPPPDEVTYTCAQIAEVEVSRDTGAVSLVRFVTAHDVGTVINPVTHQGQIDGGFVMGMGQGLMEEIVIDGGRVTNASLGDYKLPTIADVPALETILVESGDGLGPYNAKSIGEFANNSPPAAIANAVADAVGVRLFDLPVTAEKVYHALKEGRHNANH